MKKKAEPPSKAKALPGQINRLFHEEETSYSYRVFRVEL